MQFTQLVLAVAAAAGTAQATCFTSGASWGNDGAAAARGAINDLCDQRVLAGYFNPGQAKTACANLPGGKRADFRVLWLGRGGLTLNVADCKLRLTNEVNGCSRGGRSTTADWEFT